MSIKKKMVCKEVISLLSPFQDNELKPEINEEIKSHLEICKTCENQLLQLQTLIKQIKQLPYVETDCNFTPQVIRELEEKELEKKRLFSWIPTSSSLILSRVVYSFIFIIFLILGLFMNKILSEDFTKKPVINRMPEISLAQLIVESQDLSLIKSQNQIFELLETNKNQGVDHE